MNRRPLRSLPRSSHGNALIEFALIVPILLILAFPVIDFARYLLLQEKTVKAANTIADAVAMSLPVPDLPTPQQIAAAIAAAPDSYLTTQWLQGMLNATPALFRPFEPEFDVVISGVLPAPVPDPGDPGNPPDPGDPTDPGDPDPGDPDPPPAPPSCPPICEMRYLQPGKSVRILPVALESDWAPVLQWQIDRASGQFYNASRAPLVGTIATPQDRGTVQANLADAFGPNGNAMNVGESLIVVEVSALHAPITPFLEALGVPFLAETTMIHQAYYRGRYGDLSYVWPDIPRQ